MQDATRIIRSTLTPVKPGEPVHDGPVFAAPFHSPGDPADARYTYARSHNPTWTALERTIAQMESGEGYRANALVFASGMAACTAIFGAMLRPGDVVVMPSDAYYAGRVLAQEYFAQMGVEVRMAPTAGSMQREMVEGARLVWLETPSNPQMDVCDVALISEAAHKAGALVVVDNTTATPLGQRPLALGADFSVASDTKAMTGHSDLLLGHVATRDLELRQKVEQWRTLTGSIAGPMETWLAHRSIATLPLRLERASANALGVARFLETRKEIARVLYPGLRSHPGHEVAARQMQYFGPVVSFELADKAAAEGFLSSAKLVTEATSFGGVSTSAERRARWGGDAIGEGFIRMSVGCEAVEDLIEDIGRALGTISDAAR